MPRDCRLRQQIVAHFGTHRKATGSRAIVVKGRSCAIRCEAGFSKIQRLPPRNNNDSTMPPDRRRFAVAPMMEWTDRHCRFFHRLMTRHALLYTEMVTTGAVLHGNRAELIGFDPFEHPLALQLGRSDPRALAQCARIAQDLGYDEINLNVGCPSDRVQEGRFGACLMAEPSLVGEGVAAMKAAVRVPVTVKCRIGIDDQDPEESLD